MHARFTLIEALMRMRTTLHIALNKNIEVFGKLREANALKVPSGSILRLIETMKYLMSSDYLLNLSCFFMVCHFCRTFFLKLVKSLFWTRRQKIIIAKSVVKEKYPKAYFVLKGSSFRYSRQTPNVTIAVKIIRVPNIIQGMSD